MTQLPSTHPKDEATIRSFPCYQGDGVPGFIVDFLGVKTRIHYIAGLAHLSGHVESYPVPWNFHANSIEWAGVLRAVSEAKDSFVAVELGAGWGPWLVSGATLAQKHGIPQIHLVGVEGSQDHCAFMRTHFHDNGLNPEEHTLLHGVVGMYDGCAQFPLLDDPTSHWGAQAHFTPAPPPAGPLRRVARRVKRFLKKFDPRRKPVPTIPIPTETVPCFALTTLLQPYSRVDLVHVDIQGAEYEVIASARDMLREKVVRLVIGTHGRSIEERLINELGSSWNLESEEACLFLQVGENICQYRDGTQVWHNRRFASAALADERKIAA